MENNPMELDVERLGEARIRSPMREVEFVDDGDRVLYHSSLSEVQAYLRDDRAAPSFEMGGPRANIYFDPSKLKCGIVTCGGLCPGVNDVIRAVVFGLFYHYGVQTVYGYRYGFEGLTYRHAHAPLELTPRSVDGIHQKGGTILGSSRGHQDISEMVDTLERMNVGVLFAIGGDGTLRASRGIAQEIARRSLKIGVIGIPKTIDNDISAIDKTFGFETAVSAATQVIASANTEAEGARNGIGLVKVMGRESGFIAALASLSNADVNFCLVPEVPFTLDGFLKALRKRLGRRRHAVVVIGEGAGQDLIGPLHERDASGNIRLADIGRFLKDRISTYFAGTGMDVVVRYIDPSYIIRSQPANPHDSSFCLLLGHNAVHAAMAGRTNMVVGHWGNEFTHVPISTAVAQRKHIDPQGRLWNNVLASTGQPREM